MIVRALLQPPGLPLLRGGVVAVVVQQEGPHLATDGWVDTAEKDGLVRNGRGTNALSTKGAFRGQTRATADNCEKSSVCKHDVQTAAKVTQLL